MSNEFNHKGRSSRYFLAPPLITLALGASVLAFLLGDYLVSEQWSRQEKETLDSYRAVSPSSALDRAAEAVKHDRIEFAVYRDLLRAALAEQDAQAHAVAFRSIRDVLQYGGAFADDLKAELRGMAPQVFITTTTNKAGLDAGDALEKELREVGMTIVNREARDPVQIGESKVSCYGPDTCKDAKTLVPLLRDRGYALGEADTSRRSEDNSDDLAATLYNAKVIRVALMDPKQSQPTVSLSTAPGPKSHAGKSAHRTVKKTVQTASR
jgi:hypothetical protein